MRSAWLRPNPAGIIGFVSGDVLGGFLRARRERLRPADVGLPTTGRRRTPGLRRQEVAELAAVSVEWYARLEQGRVGTPGVAVLNAVAAALRLTEAERAHVHLIARGDVPRGEGISAPVSDALLAVLRGMPQLPAYVIDPCFDVLAHNQAAAALFGDDFGTGVAGNIAKLLFLDPDTRTNQLDWERIARETVGNLRANRARHPGDERLDRVVTELQAGSADFARWWDDHSVRERASGHKRVHHPLVGMLRLRYSMLAALDGANHRLFVAAPADPTTEQALRTLISAHAKPSPDGIVYPLTG